MDQLSFNQDIARQLADIRNRLAAAEDDRQLKVTAVNALASLHDRLLAIEDSQFFSDERLQAQKSEFFDTVESAMANCFEAMNKMHDDVALLRRRVGGMTYKLGELLHQPGFPNQAAVVEEVKRLAGYCNDGFRKSDDQDIKLQDQIDEVSKQQDVKFVGALRMAKVEVKTSEQRLEVAAARQFQQTLERIRVERNRITTALQHLSKLSTCTSQLKVQHGMRLASIDGKLETLIAAPASNSPGQDAESAQNLQATSRKRPRFAGRSGYEMRESTILKRRSGGDGIQTPRVRCTPTKRVRE